MKYPMFLFNLKLRDRRGYDPESEKLKYHKSMKFTETHSDDKPSLVYYYVIISNVFPKRCRNIKYGQSFNLSVRHSAIDMARSWIEKIQTGPDFM